MAPPVAGVHAGSAVSQRNWRAGPASLASWLTWQPAPEPGQDNTPSVSSLQSPPVAAWQVAPAPTVAQVPAPLVSPVAQSRVSTVLVSGLHTCRVLPLHEPVSGTAPHPAPPDEPARLEAPRDEDAPTEEPPVLVEEELEEELEDEEPPVQAASDPITRQMPPPTTIDNARMNDFLVEVLKGVRVGH